MPETNRISRVPMNKALERQLETGQFAEEQISRNVAKLSLDAQTQLEIINKKINEGRYGKVKNYLDMTPSERALIHIMADKRKDYLMSTALSILGKINIEDTQQERSRVHTKLGGSATAASVEKSIATNFLRVPKFNLNVNVL